jgi:hypothetical protein
VEIGILGDFKIFCSREFSLSEVLLTHCLRSNPDDTELNLSRRREIELVGNRA